jgi:hypothetical protein
MVTLMPSCEVSCYIFFRIVPRGKEGVRVMEGGGGGVWGTVERKAELTAGGCMGSGNYKSGQDISNL